MPQHSPPLARAGLRGLALLLISAGLEAAPPRRVIVAAPTPAPAAPRESPSALDASLIEFLSYIGIRNDRILSQRLEFEIAGHAVTSARSVFEFAFVNTALHEENRIKNTLLQALQRGQQAEFEEYNERWDSAFEGLLPGGGKLRVGYHLDDINNSLQQLAPFGDTFNEFQTVVGVTFTQPLLRNRGRQATRAKIRIAEKDRDVAFQLYRREMMRILAEAGANYWDLVLAQERLDLSRRSRQLAESILASNRGRVQSGLLPETEILEAKAGVLVRRARENQALQDHARATNRARAFLYRSAAEDPRPVHATDPLLIDGTATDLASNLPRGLAWAPEYLVALHKIEREGIRVDFARNQKKPQLDFKSSLALNGLEAFPGPSLEDAFTAQHTTWFVGLEHRLPLGGNLQALGELRSAQDRQRQALIEARSTEIELSNELDSGLKAVALTAAQAANFDEAVGVRQELLGIEQQRLQGGISTTRAVLQRDDDLQRARDEALQAKAIHAKATLALEVTRGTLLQRIGIETSPVRR